MVNSGTISSLRLMVQKIGGPESASVIDIFGAVYVDPVAEWGGPFAPTE